MSWGQLLLDKLFDDCNEGHTYYLSERMVAYLFNFPKGDSKYGRRIDNDSI